jgi:pyruvate/2-oxoglutarate/acetoin dehydrogenase E1 component
MDIDLIELRSLKPLDMDTIKASLQRTHKVHFEAATDSTTYLLHLGTYCMLSTAAIDSTVLQAAFASSSINCASRC